MKLRYAAHQVILSAHCMHTLQVVELENNVVVRLFPLTEEIAHTQWIGGAICLVSDPQWSTGFSYPLPLSSLIEQFSTEVVFDKEGYLRGETSLYAFHISAEEVANGIVQAVRRL